MQKLKPKGADTMSYPFPAKDKGEFNEQDYIKSGSSTDCTGLIPAAVRSEEEFESYKEMYSFLPPPPDENTED